MTTCVIMGLYYQLLSATTLKDQHEEETADTACNVDERDAELKRMMD